MFDRGAPLKKHSRILSLCITFALTFEVLMFHDASDAHWDSFFTQVPRSEYHGGVPVDDLSHQPQVFLVAPSGVVGRWSTTEKEAYAIMNSMRRLDYLVWNGVCMFTDHRDLV